MAIPVASAVTELRIPAPNDVIVRTLEFRDVAPGSEMDPFQMVRDFHVTRLEWTYIDFDDRNREKINEVKSLGVLFGGAGSASLHGSIRSFPPQTEAMHMVDLDGRPIVQPHMREWDDFRGIGDPTSPEFYEHHLNYFKKLVDWGAEVLHRDEPESPVFAAQRYGGGFSATGLAAFRTWLKENRTDSELAELGITDVSAFDYAVWLRERGAPVGDDFSTFDDPIKSTWVTFWNAITTDFWNRMLAEIRQYANDPALAFSSNNSSLQMWEPYHLAFDYANSELMLETAHPKHIWERTQAARRHGKIQVFGAPKTRTQPVEESEKLLLLRKVFATAYACGMLAKVPWDVYDQSPDGRARYFSKPEDLADLCAFVRASNWSDYQETAAVGPDLEHAGGVVPDIEGGSGGVYAFVREPVEPGRPILIHLVDWGLPVSGAGSSRQFVSPTGDRIPMYDTAETMIRTAAEPFRLELPTGAFSAAADAKYHLLVPTAYSADTHHEAADSNDFSQLVDRIPLSPEVTASGIRLAIPALTPWGIVEITNH